MNEQDSWDDLTEVVPIPFRNEDGVRQVREFVVREHSRVDSETFLQLCFGAVQQYQDEAQVIAGAEDVPLVDIVARSLAMSWESLAPALAFVLREPRDGKAPPTEEWICQHLNGRRAQKLIGLQEKLNGFDELKKKIEKLTIETLLAHRFKGRPGCLSESGSISTIASPPDTVSDPKKLPDDTPTDRPGSWEKLHSSDGGETEPSALG